MSVDVCVVGTGVAGALIGNDLASRGYSVLLLESGPRLSYPDMGRYQQVRRGEYPWPWHQQERDLYEDNAQPRVSLNNNRIKAVGGTTLHWNAVAQRLQPSDFKMRSLFGLGADWPMSYDDLEPWYSRAEQELGVCGGEMPGGPPRSAPYPMAAMEISYAEREFIIPAFHALGLSIGTLSSAINSSAYDGRPSCGVYATCIPMCPIHAKYTALHHISKAEATGRARVKPGCHVRRIGLAHRRKAGFAEYVDAAGQTQQVRARCFVLAGGAVEIPRLLLLSSSGQRHAGGLGNASGHVGKHYMTHPRVTVKATMPVHIGPHRTGFPTTSSWALYQHAGLPEVGNAMLFPDPRGGPEPAKLAMESNLWGAELLEHVRQHYGREVAIHVQGEMLPRPENQVRLSEGLKDLHGDPAPVIDMQFSDFERRALDRGAGVVGKLFKQMRATNIAASDYGLLKNHIMGTTRMGRSPHDSVCDAWGRCHDVDNLFIASSSLFPSAGCSSPTLTIAALALRTSDHLAGAL